MTVLTIDSDLITFFKFAIWTGGIFLAAYALIGVVFFGWDVTKARGSLRDAEKEIREQLKDVRAVVKDFNELKEKLEELGAQLEDKADSIDEKRRGRGEPPQPAGPSGGPEPPAPSPSPPAPPADVQFARGAPNRSDLDLVREVLASSDFEWTTITRLMKKTDLSREQILHLARSAPDITIGFGKRTQDHLLKLRKV